MSELCTIDEAAAVLNVPVRSLRTAAEQHGFIVRMGRAVRIEKARLGELIKKCRDQPKAQGSTSSSTGRTGSSGTPASPTAPRAAQIVEKLKKSSRPTSPQKGGQVLPLNRQT
ncbi:helix-turn-helix domain-containing protein [Salipiger marinus]|uniref:helix-turn-helix domain-containing protein n=1 Tax=Salipiger marinus TaxID=555512 RepID=UPI001E291C3E|nr:helix-turn-helix domain-containing protein [Salipiger manganoxidans]